MNNEITMQDEFEISGLIVCYKRAMWVRTIRHMLIMDAIGFCQDTARDFRSIGDSAAANGDSKVALEMSVIDAQLTHWAENGHGVTSCIPFLAIRQLVRPHRVEPDDVELYVSRLFVLSRDLSAPEMPEFLFIADSPAALYVTETNSVLTDHAGSIESRVLSQEQLDHMCRKLTE